MDAIVWPAFGWTKSATFNGRPKPERSIQNGPRWLLVDAVRTGLAQAGQDFAQAGEEALELLWRHVAEQQLSELPLVVPEGGRRRRAVAGERQERRPAVAGVLPG
jgi:hypothetical protein